MYLKFKETAAAIHEQVIITMKKIAMAAAPTTDENEELVKKVEGQRDDANVTRDTLHRQFLERLTLLDDNRIKVATQELATSLPQQLPVIEEWKCTASSGQEDM